ncbi:MAG: hypothetical protein Q7S14_02565 [bacterium]|nr:hypothetical protein [bacterium]
MVVEEMKKVVLLVLIFSLLNPAKVLAWMNNDVGIQKSNQTSISQLNVYGKIQNSYNSDSFFPLFLYWYDSNRVPEIAAAGFNTLWLNDWAGKSYEEQMDLLWQYKIRSWPNLHGVIGDDIDHNRSNWDNLKYTVNRLKTYPSFLSWWLTDETVRSHPISKWNEAYDVIKSLDPDRAIMGEMGVGGNSTECFPTKHDLSYVYSYPAGAYALDRYMGLGCPWPLFVLGQAFYRPFDATTDPPGAWPVMPTAGQVRGQLYVSIVPGATGVGMFVGFYNTDAGETARGLFPGTPQWDAVSLANHEITANKRVFLSKTSTDVYHVESASREDLAEKLSLNTVLKDTGEPGVRYLLAVNVSTMGGSGRFTFEKSISRVTSVFDNRDDLPFTGTSFTDSFGSDRLYRIEFEGIVDISNFRSLLQNYTSIFDYSQLVSQFGHSN